MSTDIKLVCNVEAPGAPCCSPADRELVIIPPLHFAFPDRDIQLKPPSCECCQIFYRLSIVVSFCTCRQTSIPSTIPFCYRLRLASAIQLAGGLSRTCPSGSRRTSWPRQVVGYLTDLRRTSGQSCSSCRARICCR